MSSTTQFFVFLGNWDQYEANLVAKVTAVVIREVETRQPKVICLASVGPKEVAHTKALCKQIRTRFPDLPIIVARLGHSEHGRHVAEGLIRSGATRVCSVLEETKEAIRLAANPEAATGIGVLIH